MGSNTQFGSRGFEDGNSGFNFLCGGLVVLFGEMTMLLIIGIDPRSRLARLWVQKN
jgi:hypothetical protein